MKRLKKICLCCAIVVTGVFLLLIPMRFKKLHEDGSESHSYKSYSSMMIERIPQRPQILDGQDFLRVNLKMTYQFSEDKEIRLIVLNNFDPVPFCLDSTAESDTKVLLLEKSDVQMESCIQIDISNVNYKVNDIVIMLLEQHNGYITPIFFNRFQVNVEKEKREYSSPERCLPVSTDIFDVTSANFSSSILSYEGENPFDCSIVSKSQLLQDNKCISYVNYPKTVFESKFYNEGIFNDPEKIDYMVFYIANGKTVLPYKKYYNLKINQPLYISTDFNDPVFQNPEFEYLTPVVCPYPLGYTDAFLKTYKMQLYSAPAVLSNIMCN
ncbi:hypothetical protein [Clostridium sp. D33t1_170424_F3]|uniref:hypothetical protein n=1 Tax=Clostridium sp. D33t1_170424_F3 TaxID=2787099 RepID=UPI0018ABC475|nr:hypothetical protein [Clostridium sp. D33t1_170424_F3]